jgi:hypothetical protein
MPKDRAHEYLNPAETKAGMMKDFEGVVFDIIEVNPVPPPDPPLVAPKSWTVSYRLRDTRQSPPLILPKPPSVAHVWPHEGENLMDIFRKIKADYEKNQATFRSVLG